MNGTWLAFFTLILVVLIAVTVGAQQMEAQSALEKTQLMGERDEAVNIALEAKDQRAVAFKARDEAVARVDGLNAEIASLKGENQRVMEGLKNAQSAAESMQKENERLVKEANAQRAQMMDLQSKYTALEAEYTQSQPAGQIAVTGNDRPVAKNAGIAAEQANCLPIQTTALPGQLGLGLAILVGMAALGSGGYIYYRHDPTRKYAVKMTKEQIRDYARYQRERGNRAG
jgi:FtsZ-binding cell division protein ZapB